MSLGNYNMYELQKGIQVKQHCYAVSEAAPTQMKIDVRNKTAAPKDFAFICGLSGRTTWFQVFSAHLRRCAAAHQVCFLNGSPRSSLRLLLF